MLLIFTFLLQICFLKFLQQQWLPTKLLNQSLSPTRGVTTILFGGICKKFHVVEVVVHENGNATFVNPNIRDPIQELRHICYMNQERGLRIAQKQMTQLRGGSIKVSKMRLISRKENMISFLKLLLKLQIQALSQLCKRRGKGEQLN